MPHDPSPAAPNADDLREQARVTALAQPLVTFPAFPDFDRRAFPAWLQDVTPTASEPNALLIQGTEKTALLDCGMAHLHAQTLEALDAALNGRPLDYVVASHSHYDHIGALPYILRAHPEAKVVGSAYAQHVFSRPGAQREIARLGQAAWRTAASADASGLEHAAAEGSAQHAGLDAAAREAELEAALEELARLTAEELRVDVVLHDGDRIDLGSRELVCLETKGHTDCALSFAVEPERVLFASESTGQCPGPGHSVTAILKSYEQTVASARKCRAYGASQVVTPHLGITPEWYAERYFDDFLDAANAEKDYMTALLARGLSFDEMLLDAAVHVWPNARAIGQNWDGFVANFAGMVKAYQTTDAPSG